MPSAKSTVGPVLGIIKAVLGFRQFLLLGFVSVQGEWVLVCIAWNLKRLHALEMIAIKKNESSALHSKGGR